MYYIWDVGRRGRREYAAWGMWTTIIRAAGNHGGAYLHPDGEDTILITDNEEYGYLASAYVAIRDSSGRPVALSCVDISMDMINRQVGSFAAAVVLVILAVLLVFIVGYFFFIRQSVLRP